MDKIRQGALFERFAVIDAKRHAFVDVEARHAHLASHRQAAVGCSHRYFLESVTACGLVAVVPWAVPGDLAMHDLGCLLVFFRQALCGNGLVAVGFVCHSFFAAPNDAEDQQD